MILAWILEQLARCIICPIPLTPNHIDLPLQNPRVFLSARYVLPITLESSSEAIVPTVIVFTVHDWDIVETLSAEGSFLALESQ